MFYCWNEDTLLKPTQRDTIKNTNAKSKNKANIKKKTKQIKQ